MHAYHWHQSVHTAVLVWASEEGMRRASNQCAVIRAGMPHRNPAMQAWFIPHLEMLTATHIHTGLTHSGTRAVHWVTAQQQLSALLAGTVKWSFGWWRNLNHLHISAGLKKLYKGYNMWPPYFLPASSALVCVCCLHAYVFCKGDDPWSAPGMNLLMERYLMVFLFSLRGDWFLLWLQAACAEDGRLPPVHRALQVSNASVCVSLKTSSSWVSVLEQHSHFVLMLITRGFKLIMAAYSQSSSSDSDTHEQIWQCHRKIICWWVCIKVWVEVNKCLNKKLHEQRI